MTLDESLANAIKQDYTKAALSRRERAMLDYVAKLTRTPWLMQEEDIDLLRENGFDDTAVLQVNLIASYFNYINRVADGLGVGRPKRDSQ
ncbi:MAG: peroxidase [Candidatus Obscuribacter sp.]|nr:peroxidase [Candidatus Obscuribacter sp.]